MGCNCGGNSSSNINESDVIVLQEEPTVCPATVHETVCVNANVTITPRVEVGDVRTFCIDGAVIGACPGTPTRVCTFTVHQNICVEIPLEFSATAEAVSGGIVCGTPLTGPCPSTTGCTFTRGFFFNHPDVTNALIDAAGGSIVLGIDAQGFSVTMTTANAATILGGNQPGPLPIYSNLYAQLATAKLNVLNGATCAFATTTIAAADAFLASGVVNQAQASALVDALTSFNEGNAEGCPDHCPES